MMRHGRLVEAKAVKEQINKWLNKVGYATIGEYYFDLMRCIDDTPTVIELDIIRYIDDTPTVIEAEEEEK